MDRSYTRLSPSLDLNLIKSRWADRVPSHHLMTTAKFNELFQELKWSQKTSCKDEHDLIMGAKYAVSVDHFKGQHEVCFPVWPWPPSVGGSSTTLRVFLEDSRSFPSCPRNCCCRVNDSVAVELLPQRGGGMGGWERVMYICM